MLYISVFREEPRDTTVVKGQPLTFHCIAEDSTNPSANIIIEWRKNGAAVQQRNGVTVFNNGTLHKTTTQTSDEGSYSCFASLLTSGGIIQQKESVAAMLYFACKYTDIKDDFRIGSGCSGLCRCSVEVCM